MPKLEMAISATFDTGTCLIIFRGYKGTVDKKTFIKYFEHLSELHANKIVLFTLCQYEKI